MSPSTMMIACDKNGGSGNVTESGFGENHPKPGGNVLYGDSSVVWVPSDQWSSNTWGVADLSSLVGY